MHSSRESWKAFEYISWIGYQKAWRTDQNGFQPGPVRIKFADKFLRLHPSREKKSNGGFDDVFLCIAITN